MPPAARARPHRRSPPPLPARAYRRHAHAPRLPCRTSLHRTASTTAAAACASAAWRCAASSRWPGETDRSLTASGSLSSVPQAVHGQRQAGHRSPAGGIAAAQARCPRLLACLTAAGTRRTRTSRRNLYTVNPDSPFRHPARKDDHPFLEVTAIYHYLGSLTRLAAGELEVRIAPHRPARAGARCVPRARTAAHPRQDRAPAVAPGAAAPYQGRADHPVLSVSTQRYLACRLQHRSAAPRAG